MGFNLFDGLFDFDGDGSIDGNDVFLGSMFTDRSERCEYGAPDPDDDENEESDDYDPFFAQDYSSSEEFYEDNAGDFSDLEEAEDYYSDWG